jgi:chromosome segregation ATPase
MLVQLWGAACEKASRELAAVRTELELQLTEAQLEAQHAKSEALAASERSARTEAAAAQLTANLRELADSLDQLDRDRQAAGEENKRLSQGLEAAQAASSEARAAFTSDLKIVRDALATAEERAKSSEQRSLLEIDQERQRGARVVKRLEAERDGLASKLAEQEDRIATGRVQLGEAQSQNAGLVSALAAAQSQIVAQSKAMTEILGRMDTLQEAITAAPPSPGRKTSGKARSKTAKVNSPRTRAAKAGR